MNSTPFQKDLDKAAGYVQKKIEKSELVHYPIQIPQSGGILGTGWKGALKFDTIFIEIPLKNIPGFEPLGELEGHDRILRIGLVGNRLCAFLEGRIHLNEAPPSDEDIFRMVRLQVELLIVLGVETMILTNAAGSLSDHDLKPGAIVVVNGFMRYEAGAMPLVAGEFHQVDSVLDEQLREIIFLPVANKIKFPRLVRTGILVMTRGPVIESIHEKEYMAGMHANVMCAGMSMLPEALVCAHHEVKVLPISCISNGMYEWPSHKEVMRRLAEYAPDNGKLIRETILSLPVRAGMVF